MSKAEFLIIAGTLIGTFVTLLSAIEKDIIKIFLEKDATSAQRAIKVQKKLLFSRWRLNRFKRRAVLIKTDSGMFYYNASKYKILLKKRVITVIILFAILLILTFIFFN